MNNTSARVRARTMPRRLASLGPVLLITIAACGGDEEAPAAGPVRSGPPPAVVVAKLETQDVPILREFVARTEAVQTVEVKARVEAVLEMRDFEEGRRVKKDDVLYRLDDRTYVAELAAATARKRQAEANLKLAQEQVSVRAAEASLARAEAKLKKAQQDVARLRPLAEKDAVPRQDLDTALAAEEVAQAEVDAEEATLTNARIEEEVGIALAQAELQSAEASLDLAELDLEYCTIRSPLDGLVGRTQVNIGNLVGRGESTPLVTVSSIDPIYVTFSISEAEYLRSVSEVRASREAQGEPPADPADRRDGEGIEVQLILADDSVFAQTGRIVTADRAVAEETGTLQIVTEFPNPDGDLRPGQFGRARMVVTTIPDALLVPQRAIMEQQSAKVVLVVGEGNKVALRSVRITERHEDYYVVADGLNAGDIVIVEGQLKTRPGMQVTPTDRAITSEPDGGAPGGGGSGQGTPGQDASAQDNAAAGGATEED